MVLKVLWDRINECLEKIISGRAFTAPVAHALFALVANRALAPASKLAVEQWAPMVYYSSSIF